jgi:hypothetical protein
MDDNQPGRDCALTLDQLIDALETHRRKLPEGGQTRVEMCDGEPVVRAVACQARNIRQALHDLLLSGGTAPEPEPEWVVVITDRYEADE